LLALVMHGLATEQPAQHVKGLVEQATTLPGVDGLPEGAELAPSVVAETDADDDSAVRKLVEARHLPGHHPRPAATERRDERADAERLGRGRHGRQRHAGA